MSSISDTSLYGGKNAPAWNTTEFRLPGYNNCRIIALNLSTKKEHQWGFMISPNGLSIQHNLDVQVNKTMAGYMISRNGSMMGTLSLTGFFLDTLKVPERLRFWDYYTRYLCDKQNSYMEYSNDHKLYIMIEGQYYWGVVQGLSMSKSANQQFLYQYTLNFLFYKVEPAYKLTSSSMTEKQLSDQMGLSKSKTSPLSTGSAGSQSLRVSASISGILDGGAGY